MSAGIALGVRTTLAPEMFIGDTRVLAESQAIVLQLPWAAFVWNRPLAMTAVRNGCGQRVQIHRQPTKGVHTMIETMNGSASSLTAQQVRHQTNEFFDKILAAAQPSAVFSAPVVSGAYMVITASEVFAGGGFGFGGGAGPAEHSRSTRIWRRGARYGAWQWRRGRRRLAQSARGRRDHRAGRCQGSADRRCHTNCSCCHGCVGRRGLHRHAHRPRTDRRQTTPPPLVSRF